MIYSAVDKTQATLVDDTLTNFGFPCWMDKKSWVAISGVSDPALSLR